MMGNMNTITITLYLISVVLWLDVFIDKVLEEDGVKNFWFALSTIAVTLLFVHVFRVLKSYRKKK